MKKRIPFIVLGMAFSINAHAGCFNADPYAMPTSEIKVTIGESAEHLYGFGESPEGRASNPFSPSPSADLKAQDAQQVSGTDSIKVRYYEPSSNNTYRICRTDLWLPRHSDVPNAQTLSHSKRLIAHTLSKRLIESNRTLGFSTIYAYDSKGRVIRVEEADFRGGSDTVFKPLHCRRYDDKDRVILWVNPSETHACPKGDPSLRDEWREYRYGNRNGADARLRSRWHYPEKDGWEETWTSFSIDASPDAVRGNAHVDDRRGVWEIFGSTYGKRDDNAANTVVDEFGRWNGSNYYFPNPPVPLSILENPDELYKYLRRRITHVDGRVRLVELFKPGEHVSQHRFYTLLGLVLRHEQLNQKGEVKRIITVSDWRQPRPGTKPAFDDRLLTARPPTLKTHQVYHRVYEVDSAGKPTLVAMSWNRKLRNPFKEVPLLSADLVFGTPDGREKWKSREEFDRAFDTSEDARQVFPDKP